MPQPITAMLGETFPGTHSHWVPSKDMQSQRGRNALVTGGYGGIGLETVAELLAHEIDVVYVVGRNRSKYDTAVNEWKRRGLDASDGQRTVFVNCDLGSLQSVQKAGEEMKRIAREGKLHMFFASAGVMMNSLDMRSEDNLDLQLATNVLGHHHLMNLCMPLMLQARSRDFSPRICVTSSSGHNFSPGFDANDAELKKNSTINSSWTPDINKRSLLYGNSKLGNILQARKLHRMYGSQGIVVASCNPGNLETDLTRHLNGFFGRILQFFVRSTLLFPAHYGSYNQLWVCTSDEGEKLGGQYVVPWTRVANASETARDEKAQDGLWDWCEAQVKRVLG